MLSLLLSSLLTGCSSDTEERLEQGEPVSFSIEFCKPSTRSTIDNIWPDNTEITVYNGTDKHNYKTGANSSAGTSGAATALTPVSEAFYWTINNPNWQFSAWYPAGTTATTSMTVAEDQSAVSADDYNAYDILYCSPAAAAFKETIPLHFHHQMARVIVIVSSSLTEQKETVTSVAFGGNKLGLTGTITTPSTTGENGTTVWSVEESIKTKSITMRPRAADTDTERYLYAFECMVVPQTYASDTGVVYLTTTGSTDGNRSYTYTSTFDLKAGYQYIYNLVLSEQGTIKLATVQVEDWDDTPVNVDNTATIPDNNYPN